MEVTVAVFRVENLHRNLFQRALHRLILVTGIAIFVG